MARLIFTDEAKHDLLGIRQYTQKVWGVTQANVYIRELRNTLHRLLEMPLIGTDRSADLGSGIFSFPQASHMIYYSILDGDLIVLGLLHQSMVPALHLNRGR